MFYTLVVAISHSNQRWFEIEQKNNQGVYSIDIFGTTLHLLIVESIYFRKCNTIYHLKMASISNKYLVDQNITSNELDDTIDTCFEYFQLIRDATNLIVKTEYKRFCWRFHPDKNISTCASKVMNILNKEKRYIDYYFYFIGSQVRKIHKSYSNSDME